MDEEYWRKLESDLRKIDRQHAIGVAMMILPTIFLIALAVVKALYASPGG